MDTASEKSNRPLKLFRKPWIVIVAATTVVAVLLFLLQFSRFYIPWVGQLFSNPGANLVEGNRLLESGQYPQAITVFNSAILDGYDLANAYAGRGDAYRNLRRFDEAIDDYTTSLKYVRSATVLAARCSVYTALAQFDLSRSDCEAAISLDAQNVDARIASGLLYLELGDSVRAYEEVETAIQIDPRSVNAHFALSQIETSRGDLNMAVTAVSKCIELDPKNARWYWERGYLYFLMGQTDLSGADMQAVLKYGKPDVDGELLLRAGTMLHQLGVSP
jgi:tetratricopeptide (TPR) repeat protein